MKHILPFPFPDTPEHAADRQALRMKLGAGRLIQGIKYPRCWAADGTPDYSHWQDYPCWHYAGKWTDGKGYKKVKYKGHVIYVHRASVELFSGPIPDGHLVDHLCKDHGCWQPEHLEPVPTKVNIERGDNPNWLMRNGARTGRVRSDVPNFVEVRGASDRVPPQTLEQMPRPLIDADFAEVEKRAAAHYGAIIDDAGPVWPHAYEVRGKLGDVPVALTTHRPEFWSTPDLYQAHVEHEHPRFRAPLGALEPARRDDNLNDLPDPWGYSFPDAPIVPVHDAVFDDSELRPRPLWLRVVRFLKNFGRFTA